MGDFGTISTLPAGTLLNNRYEIQRVVGQGGMGIVYLAVDRALDESQRAIKTIKPELLSDPRGSQQIKNEARAAQMLSHPNIVRVYHYEEWEGISYLVMEYIGAKTLAEILTHKEQLSEEEFLPIAKQLCEGLNYAHQQDLIHQDIKPTNIFVGTNGDTKLADFGIARVTKDITTRMTGVMPSGTLIYTCPEVLRGEKPTTTGDIYSIGIVFYEMISGAPPFIRGDIFRQHQEFDPKPLTGAPRQLNDVIMACLEKDPAKRPESAKKVQQLLSCETSQIKSGIERKAPETAQDVASAVRTEDSSVRQLRAEGKSWLTAVILCFVLGIFGAHRFYTGHKFTGILQFLTFGGMGIWWLFDLILLLTDSFRHADGSLMVK